MKVTTAKIIKRCPFCGIFNINRRVCLGGYRCYKCHKIFNKPVLEEASLLDLNQLPDFCHSTE